MKNNIKFLIFFIAVIVFNGCKDEIITDPAFEISYLKQGETVALAGSPIYVYPTGSAEFLTLYDGKSGNVWGEAGAKGIDFNRADSLEVVYNNAGTYQLTVVATSTNKLGKETTRVTETKQIQVVDERNTLQSFKVTVLNKEVDAQITNNEVIISVPDIVTDFNFIPTFTLNSSLAKAYINNVEQISGITSASYSPGTPVTFTIKSAQGNENVYTVKTTTFPASSAKQLTSFILGPTPASGAIYSNGEIAVIDEVNKKINLALNYASKTNGPKINLSSSQYSTVQINNAPYSVSKNYNLATITSVKVIAQDGSVATYTLNMTLQNPVVSFKFTGFIPEPTGIIDPVAKTINVNVLSGTDITKLVAKWTGSLSPVQIGSVVQKNGETINDFSIPQIYTFYKGTVAGDSYTVTVNIK